MQQQAFAQSQELAAQRDELIQMIDDRMVEIEPAVEALIEQRDELIATLQSATPDTPGEVMQQASGAYQNTLQELQTYQQQALGDSAIQSMQSQLQQAALEVMQEIDPEIDAIIERFNEARTELMQMQQAQ